MDELVLLQVLAALCDVSGDIQQVDHGQTGQLLLQNNVRRSKTNRTAVEVRGCQVRDNVRMCHLAWPSLPQETLQVSSGHQLQQDEPGRRVQTDANTSDNVLVAELTAKTNQHQPPSSCRSAAAAGSRNRYAILT